MPVIASQVLNSHQQVLCVGFFNAVPLEQRESLITRKRRGVKEAGAFVVPYLTVREPVLCDHHETCFFPHAGCSRAAFGHGSESRGTRQSRVYA